MPAVYMKNELLHAGVCLIWFYTYVNHVYVLKSIYFQAYIHKQNYVYNYAFVYITNSS